MNSPQPVRSAPEPTLCEQIRHAVRSQFKRPSTHSPAQGVSRRDFIKLGGIAGGGFTLAGFMAPSLAASGSDPEGMGDQLMVNAFVHISPGGAISLYSHTPEMGQGVKTAIPMIIAEELGADWQDVTIVQAPVNEAVYGTQRAGGSTSVPRNWNPMREVGAAARTMFIAAAAAQWEADPADCYTRNSQVIHKPSGRTLGFGDLAGRAAQQSTPVKQSLEFKKREDYTLLGTGISGVDNRALVTGQPLFGVDVQLPGLLHAVYEKCPAFYGTVKSANVEHIKTLPGIVDAFVVEGEGEVNGLLSGVAIVAKTSWQAMNARQSLKVEWDETRASKDSWTAMRAEARKLAGKQGARQVANVGDVESQLQSAGNTVVKSFYTYPYVAHACMEPMNCTAWYHPASGDEPESMEVWAPTQAPSRIFGMVEARFGIPMERVTVHQTRMGGGFGRRGRLDFSSEAAIISHRLKAPVKLSWTREDDMTHDFYRAGGFYSFQGAVDKTGKLVAMDNHLIGPGFEGRATSGTYQRASEFPGLNLPNYRSSLTLLDTKTPCGPWRAPGSNVTGFAVQSFIAEMAQAAGRDHLEFLLEIMGEPRWFEPGNTRSLNTGRATGVIKLAAEKAGWGRAMPPGRGLGLSFHFSHAAHVAEVAEVSVDADKKLTVHKITAAVDIGPVINRSGAVSQVEGAMLDGLSTLFDLAITMENGRIEQSNFHNYKPLRIKHTPQLETHFIESDYPPTGIGEPALPPLAAAIGNAIFAATGERVRSMPLTEVGYTI